MGDQTSEVEYVKSEGFVRLQLRRPVKLYVPSDQLQTYDPYADRGGPKGSLDLEWVYGYRGRDGRNNLLPLASGEIVYFAAAVAVIYNPKTKTQRLFVHHTDDIKSLAVHPDGKTIATGQIKGKEKNLPHVAIWDSQTLKVTHILNDSLNFDRGIAALAFSKEGDLLAAVDEAVEPHLSVWKWNSKTKVTDAKASSDQVLAVTFSAKSSSKIITSGKNHLTFWTLKDGKLTKQSAVFGSYPKPKHVTAVTSLPTGEVISGDSNGNILTWKDGTNTVNRNVLKAHSGSVFYLQATSDGNILSAGADGKITVYGSDLKPTTQSTKIATENGLPRVAFKLGERLIVGTTNNSILSASFKAEPIVPITQGHVEELWGLAVHPTEAKFVTAGEDGSVFFRDAKTHDTIWMKTLEIKSRSADISPSGTLIVVGGHGGKWAVLSKESKELHRGLDGTEPIQVVRFSPDGSKLALGSRDNNIYIYNVGNQGQTFTKAGVLKGHSSFITHLDWSADGKMVRSNSGDYEVLFWKLDGFSLETKSEKYRDVIFNTNNCILSFNSIGIWPPGTDGTDINGCNKAVTKPLIATGDDFGNVKLFAYPASTQNAKNETYLGHSSHVTAVAFFNGDSSFVSAGGRDSTAMQWKVKEK